MKKFIYRLAIVTHTDVEEMFPYYFDNKETALRFAELYATNVLLNYSPYLEEYNHKKTGDYSHCCFSQEYKCSRCLRYDFLYKDNRVSYNRYLAITNIELFENI